MGYFWDKSVTNERFLYEPMDERGILNDTKIPIGTIWSLSEVPDVKPSKQCDLLRNLSGLERTQKEHAHQLVAEIRGSLPRDGTG